MGLFEEWESFAPAPREKHPQKDWDVFLSYRSVNRPWAICLYDVLSSQKHKVFLDQLVLKAGDKLEGTISDALTKSRAGVLIWSSDAANSEWVKDEYYKMKRLSEKEPDFHFVPIKLDEEALPGFAEERIYIDFSTYPDGPSGGELLRLLHAVVGQPLSNEAAKLAAKLNDDVKETLDDIKALVHTGDADGLVDLFDEGGVVWSISATLPCKAAEALTRLDKTDEAIRILELTAERFPKAIRPKQLLGLALARNENAQDFSSAKMLKKAQRILGRLYAAGQTDTETLGIYGRTWMDRYNLTNNINDLEQSRDLYLKAFKGAPTEYYPGINAAAKSVLRGSAKDLKLAANIATEVQEIVGEIPEVGDYWKTATIAEVYLIKQEFEAAANTYKAAISFARQETGSHKSTWTQACRLMEKLKPTNEERAMVREAFAHLDDCPSN